jgi:hypothetical protein
VLTKSLAESILDYAKVRFSAELQLKRLSNELTAAELKQHLNETMSRMDMKIDQAIHRFLSE